MSPGWILVQKSGQITADICQTPTTNLTQHNRNGPDDHLKTIDYHHLGMARDDGMDEHGYGWVYGCHLVGFWHRSWGKSQRIFVKPRPQTRPITTHMGQMTTSKPLIIIIWACQEMMAWMSMDMVGSMNVIWLDFGL
jgi:hypothetical protein